MINKGTVLLETDRLILRKFKYSDAEYMFKNWGSDPKVSKFLSWPTHSDVNVSQKIINNWIEEYNNNIYNWAIELKSIHEAIGAISIVELDQASEACEKRIYTKFILFFMYVTNLINTKQKRRYI